MSFAAAVFDLFGTLVPNYDLQVFADLERQIAVVLDLTVEDLRSRWSATAADRMSGVYPTLADNFASICTVPPPAPYPDAVLEAERLRTRAARTLMAPHTEDLATLAAIRAAGLRVAMVSNCTPEVPALWRESPLADLIDAPIFSTEVGLLKPDPAIYHAASRQLGVEPQACLYVGDGEHQELAGAAATGMTAVLLRRRDRDGHIHDPNADSWPGPILSRIPEVLSLLAVPNRGSPP